MPDQGGEAEEVGRELGLPSQEGKAGEAWLPDHWFEVKAWLPSSPSSDLSSLSVRRIFFNSLEGGKGVMKHSFDSG